MPCWANHQKSRDGGGVAGSTRLDDGSSRRLALAEFKTKSQKGAKCVGLQTHTLDQYLRAEAR